jgi:hypothetical protein
LLGVLAGTASIAATNSIITAGEIRTSHFIIIDNHGKELYEMKGTDGVFKDFLVSQSLSCGHAW